MRDTYSHLAAGTLLIAMPLLGDTRFRRSVVLICAHSDHGTTGVIVNRTLHSGIRDALPGAVRAALPDGAPLRDGGPAQPGRLFVLHGPDWRDDGRTVDVSGDFALTTGKRALKARRDEGRPSRVLVARGYAAWGAGQLAEEMHANAWLTAPADPDLVFDAPDDEKWARAIGSLGVDASILSPQHGHA